MPFSAPRLTTPRFLLPALAAALLLLPCVTAAAETFTVGSDLQAAPNTSFGCNARPYPDITSPTGMTFINTGTPSCTWWSTTYGTTVATGASTYLPRGNGRVIAARVRSGPNPAPLRISIVSSGSQTCCSGRGESATFQPLANAVTEVPLSLDAASGISVSEQFAYSDIVAITAVGPGTLPIHDQGEHGNFANQSPGRSFSSFVHPALAPAGVTGDVGLMDGYEVLLQAVWCGTRGAGAAQAAQACPGGAVPPGPGPGAASAPVAASSGTAKVKRGRAALKLRCTAALACEGSVVLRPRTQSKPVLGRRSFVLGAGKRGTVKVKLTKAGRKRVKSGTIKARAFVTMKDGTTATLAMKLKR